jgi:hypothetical protein
MKQAGVNVPDKIHNKNFLTINNSIGSSREAESW